MSSSEATRSVPWASSVPWGASRSAPMLSMLFRSAGVLAVLAVPLLSGLGVVSDAPLAERQQQRSATLWKAAYSERYPGCVPTVLWPADERPVAVVTRTPDGRIDRVALDPDRHLVQPLPAAARTIGACR
jgi:hypothetical protein